MKPAKPLTRRELDIMSVLWKQGSATAGEIQESLPDDLSYSTIMTVLRTLEFKGHVRHSEDGKAFKFFPVTQQEAAGSSAVKRLVDKVYHGSRELMINRMIESEEVSVEELKRIREFVDRKLKDLDS